jgi:hypothetical protein
MSQGINPFEMTVADAEAFMAQTAGHRRDSPSRLPLTQIAKDAGATLHFMDVGYGSERLIRSMTAQAALAEDGRVYRRDLPSAEVFDRIEAARDRRLISRGAANRKAKRLRRRVRM